MARKRPQIWYEDIEIQCLVPDVLLMPRNENSDTCRRRKVKCDGALPDCSCCTKLRIPCQKSMTDFKFIIHTNQPCASGLLSDHTDVDRRADLATESAFLPPRIALQNPDVAFLYRHYINSLAPWYDLNDATSVFGTIVPVCALDVPVLFRAVIAFSCTHWAKMTGKLGDIAFTFHAACVEALLHSLGDVQECSGEYLAAACLLRSYEILNESMLSPQCHLLGAYSLSTAIDLDLSSWGLPQAGFWNYLREEITVGLACRRRVRISSHFPQFRAMVASPGVSDDMRANLITYTLACVMNIYFPSDDTSGGRESSDLTIEQLIQWKTLQEDLAIWRQNLPSTFEPFSRASFPGSIFPSLWTLRPWHVCASQYASIAEMLLILYSPQSEIPSADIGLTMDRVQELAINVCALASTTESVAARVNSFGPLSFCGRYLIQDQHRKALEAMLIDFQRPTGWPVGNLITVLKECWAQSDHN